MSYDEFLRGAADVIAPARRAAFEVVRRVFEDDAYADRALASAAGGLDTRDRALAQRIAYGTVQRRRTIDHGIDELGRRPVRKLDPPVLAALRIAGYELGWSDAPAHAVADDAVELVRAAGLERAIGFTNAVARRLAEGFRALVESLPDGPLKHSYPDWIYETWVRDWGVDEALALDARAERAGRARRPLGASRSASRPTSRAPTASTASTRPRSRPAAIWPQSRGSQLAALVVGSRDGERVLDACAAPGGKATMLRGEVTAVELHAGPRPRAGGERRAGSARRTSASSTPTCASSPSAASTARSSTHRARGSACSAAAPTSAGGRGRCPSSSSSSSGRRPSGRGPAARSSTRSAR